MSRILPLTDTQALFVLTRFRYWGWDTYRIAVHMGVKESSVYNALHRMRETHRWEAA